MSYSQLDPQYTPHRAIHHERAEGDVVIGGVVRVILGMFNVGAS